MYRFPTSVITVAIVAVTACSKPTGTPTSAAPAAAPQPGGLLNPLIEATTFSPALKVDLKGSTKSASGLYYRDVTVGSGTPVAAGTRVSVTYDGAFADGTRFEAGPYAFVLGSRSVIAGWDEGIVGMRPGGTRQLIIPPDLAYGPNGSGKIPGNAVLVFSVELVRLN